MLHTLKVLSKNLDLQNENTLMKDWKREVAFDGEKYTNATICLMFTAKLKLSANLL